MPTVPQPRICIPTSPQHAGGGFYFLHLLREYLTRTGAPWTENAEEQFDILFVNSWLVPYEMVLALKLSRARLRVVQRVDGAARDYGRADHADHGQARVNMLADATIFQSRYGKFATREKFRIIAQDGPIIYNPVDLEMFRAEGEKVALPGEMRVCNAAWSTNRMKGTWQIGELARANPDFTFVLCGRYPPLPPLPNIHLTGHLAYDALARVMRSCELYLELSENETCPNVVLQALASGLPVLYKDSGGTPEIVASAGIVLDRGLANFHAAAERALGLRPMLARIARERAETQFAPDAVFPRYLEAMARAERRPLPGRWDVLKAALGGYPMLADPFWQYPVRKLAALFRRRPPGGQEAGHA